MCARDQLSFWWDVVLLLLVLCFAARTVSGQETSELVSTLNVPASGTVSPFIETPPTDPWNSFAATWQSLKDELIQSAEDSVKLSALLQGLRTEADGLRFSLAQSILQFEASEAARMIEREAAEAKVTDAILQGMEAAKSRDRWKTIAVVTSTIAGILGISLVSIVF